MISIVVVNDRASPHLRECLRSIEEHCPLAETVVVDASAPDRAELIAREFPRVKLVAPGEDRGGAGACNLGLAWCRGEFLVLLDVEAVLEDDSLSQCVAWLRANGQVGAVSPTVLDREGKPKSSRHPLPALEDRLRAFVRKAPPDVARPFWLSGPALVLRRKALEAIGGRLDDRYFWYWSDVDLCTRLRQAGWDLAVWPLARIRHEVEGGRRPERYAWYAWGRLRWFATHRPAREAVALYGLEVIDVFRKLLRSAWRRDRRHEAREALQLARVLMFAPLGLRPPKPPPARDADGHRLPTGLTSLTPAQCADTSRPPLILTAKPR